MAAPGPAVAAAVSILLWSFCAPAETFGEIPNGSAWAITTQAVPDLDETHLVVGRVVQVRPGQLCALGLRQCLWCGCDMFCQNWDVHSYFDWLARDFPTCVVCDCPTCRAWTLWRRWRHCRA